jgi:hypothetical protein
MVAHLLGTRIEKLLASTPISDDRQVSRTEPASVLLRGPDHFRAAGGLAPVVLE